MLPQILNKDQVPIFVEFLQQVYRVAGPVVKEKGFFDYAVIDRPEELALDYDTSVQSPKKYFFPPFDALFKYAKDSGRDQLNMEIDAPRTVLLGVHPCDVYATWLLDDVFGKNPQDPYYLARRNRTVIIALDCLKPCDERSFCLDMGSLYVQSGFDVMLTDLGNRYYVEVASEIGENLVNQSDVFLQATAKDHAAHQQAQVAKQNGFKYKIPYETKYLPEMLDQSYDSLIWDANARRCFSCGSCNLTCPTCYCFDVTDDDQMNLKQGARVRRWDGCQLKNFAEVAGGENFRVAAGSRLRHRLMRKGRYMRMIYGKSGCVGCGRCDRNCPADISALRTYQQIAATSETKG